MDKAIILNSGTGSRMGELTIDRPKCLVEIRDNETILSRQLEILSETGFSDIIITTGPFENKIKHHLANRFAHLKIAFVYNPQYRKTNYIYSILLTEHLIKKDFILLHGDLVFDREVVDLMLNSRYENAVLINPHIKLPEKDFKAKMEGSLVKKIGVDFFGDDCAFLLPIYRLTTSFFQNWLKEMKIFQSKNKLDVYAEDALNNLLHNMELHVVEIKDEFCMEVDNIDDLRVAQSYIANAGEV